jgi:hypothetical protein
VRERASVNLLPAWVVVDGLTNKAGCQPLDEPVECHTERGLFCSYPGTKVGIRIKRGAFMVRRGRKSGFCQSAGEQTIPSL